MSILERVKNRIIEVGDCWEWQGAYSNKRLPVIAINRKPVPIRRALAEEAGILVKGRKVMCGCGNWRCVNPEHSKVLPYSVAMKMVSAKGNEVWTKSPKRFLAGKDKRKLTDEQVAYVRSSGKSHRELARELGCDLKTIGRIKRGEGYVEVAGANMWAGLMRRAA